MILAVSGIVAINGVSIISLITVLIGSLLSIIPSKPNKKQTETAPTNEQTQIPNPQSTTPNSQFRIYRKAELQRAIASLKANSPLLIAGEEGSGKSVLKEAIQNNLENEGFSVVSVERLTAKQMLVNICEQLNIDTYNLEGKQLTADQLKTAIASYFSQEIAFLLVDDAHSLPLSFRQWLKSLKNQSVPMLILATDPPRSDLFLNLPRIELKPLPEYAVRELMAQAALERGLNLTNSELAKLQERTGGNPMLAQRVVDEEYLGLDNDETGDHRRYFDITPLILLIGTGFIVMRFIALGTNNMAMYVMAGAVGALFLGVSRILYGLPKDSRRIE